jgi:acyl dehydratase
VNPTFDSMPSMNRLLLRGLLRRRSAGAVPEVAASCANVTTDEQQLAAYRNVCDLPESDALPLLWPQVIAGALHAAVLTHPSMPFGVLGIVHMAQTTTQLRPIGVDEPLDIQVRSTPAVPAKRGAIFGIRTDISVGGEPVWHSDMGILAPKLDIAGAPPERIKTVLPETWDTQHPWIVPESIGRTYRKVSGDMNPIHLHVLLAKPFGFRRAIAHGMWTLARAIHDIPTDHAGLTVNAQFRKPVFLPSKPVRKVTRDGARQTIALMSADDQLTHLIAECTAS